MERYFIYAVMLYALIVVIYLLWERGVKRRKNAARKKGYNPFKASPKEDIIGKSKFTLRHSKPQAATTLKHDASTKKKGLICRTIGYAEVCRYEQTTVRKNI